MLLPRLQVEIGDLYVHLEKVSWAGVMHDMALAYRQFGLSRYTLFLIVSVLFVFLVVSTLFDLILNLAGSPEKVSRYSTFCA
jgi:hypothetical protein